MKTLKYTFYKENIGVKEGELVELDPTTYECQFAVTMKSLELFEDEYGKPLINVIFGNQVNGVVSGDETQSGAFVRALACASYIKIENNEVLQNEATKDEFKNLEIYNSVSSDLGFAAQLLGLAIGNIQERTQKALEEAKRNNKPRKN